MTSRVNPKRKEMMPPSVRHHQNEPVKLNLRGSGSYPAMARASSASGNKAQKRNSESSVNTGIKGMSAQVPVDQNKSSSRKKRVLKKSVYSRATRRKSVEELELVVRKEGNPRGSKLQRPEKNETDVFNLLPKGCMQVRSLSMKSSKNEEYSGLKGGTEEDNVPDVLSSHNPASQKQLQPKYNSKLSDSETPDHDGQGMGQLVRTKTDWSNRHNISVIVRIRPKQPKELKEKLIAYRQTPQTVLFDPVEKDAEFYFQGVKQLTRNDFGRKRPNRNVTFHFDRVYGPDSTNRQIFAEMLQDLTDHLIDGYNSTVFAYGATGSGKTFTMLGSQNNPGLTVLMVEELYNRIEMLSPTFECDVTCSYLEVYNETIKDLLSPEKELSIREDGKKGIIIPELSFYKPRGPSELLKLLRSGNRARTQHATDLNSESSRSHAVFEVKISLKKRNLGDKTDTGTGMKLDTDGFNKVEVIHSKLVMVDLAGSERGAATLASSMNAGCGSNQAGLFVSGGGIGARQREGASINKSLLALANCISALADGKGHIPYRNSKLTRLLKDALSGHCTTVMIANISPSVLTSEDTYNTLKYADRAKSIVGPGIKQKNIFLEDLIIEDCVRSQVMELQAKLTELAERLEEEKLKNAIITKEHLKLKAKSEEYLAVENNSGRTRNYIQRGGGDADNMNQNISRQFQGHNEMGGSARINHGRSERILSNDVKEYVAIAGERARIFSEYVDFASEDRLQEWILSCKKLKCDMGDFLERLPVSDKNYVSFCKLKNEVNNVIQKNPEVGENTLCTENYIGHQETHHRRYAIKLKNLTERLEFVRREVILKSAKLNPEEKSSNYGSQSQNEKNVTISLEDFLLFNRLLGEQEANDKMEQFYQQFCQQINGQLVTFGRTLTLALKLVRNLYSKLKQTQGLTKGLQEDYQELADLVYGPDQPLFHPQTFTQNLHDSHVPEHFYHPNHLHNNKVVNDNFRSISDTSLISLPNQAPPPPTRLKSVPVVALQKAQASQGPFGRRSFNILEDLSNMTKLVDDPLLIQLTSLLAEDDDDEQEYDEDETPKDDFVEVVQEEEDQGYVVDQEEIVVVESPSVGGRTSRISNPVMSMSSLIHLPNLESARSVASSSRTYNKSEGSGHSSDEGTGNWEDCEEFDIAKSNSSDNEPETSEAEVETGSD